MKTFFCFFTLRQGCFIVAVVYFIMRGGFITYEVVKTIWSQDTFGPSEDVHLVFRLLWDSYFMMLALILFFGAVLENSWLLFAYISLSYFKIVMVTTYRFILILETDNKALNFFKQTIELIMDVYFFITCYGYYKQIMRRWKCFSKF